MTTKTTLPLIEIDSVEYNDEYLWVNYIDEDFDRKRVMFYIKDFEEEYPYNENTSMEDFEKQVESFFLNRFPFKEKAENTELKEKLEKATGSLLLISLKVDGLMKAHQESSSEGAARAFCALKEIKDELKKS